MTVLTEGAEKIILSLYKKTTEHHGRMSQIPEYRKIMLLAFVPFHVPVKSLRKEGIYRSFKIYRTLKLLEERGIIKSGKRTRISDRDYRKRTMKEFGKNERIDCFFGSALNKEAILAETRKSPYIRKKRMRKAAANRIIELQKESGVMWHPKEKFVHLTPYGMDWGKNLLLTVTKSSGRKYYRGC